MQKENDFRYKELCDSCKRLRKGKLYEECNNLIEKWEENNMLYNSLRFHQLYNAHVEQSNLVENDMICIDKNWEAYYTEWHRDVMTGWWMPTKYFLLKTNKGSRKEQSIELLKKISQKNDLSKLTKELALIRSGKDDGISKGVKGAVEAFMDFLEVIYCKGNFTCAAVKKSGGSLDNWDAKLENIKKEYLDSKKWCPCQWKQYVEGNAFQDYFNDEDKFYTEIIPFWDYGPSKLAEATDENWEKYFRNVKNRIMRRNKRLEEALNKI